MSKTRAPGLAEAIAGTVRVADVLHEGALSGVDLIARGSPPSNSSELLGSERFRTMIKELSSI
jgi:tyrosine-protein kinase Etk/Wzc